MGALDTAQHWLFIQCWLNHCTFKERRAYFPELCAGSILVIIMCWLHYGPVVTDFHLQFKKGVS